jgi:hypothetical protein
MTHTPQLSPCNTCGSQAAAYMAPTGVGYLIECSNADCPSRHASHGISAHVSTQGAAALWNRRQGVTA